MLPYFFKLAQLCTLNVANRLLHFLFKVGL